MTILAWRDGLYLKKQLSEPMKSGVSVASHLIEHPIGYDGSPEHMLLTIGASMWVRHGSGWYSEHCPGSYMEDVLTDQLTSVVLSMAQLNRLIKEPPTGPQLHPQWEDLVWAVLMRASADSHALTGDAQIVQLAGWLKEGLRYTSDRWNGEEEGIYKAFLSATDKAEEIICGHLTGKYPPHREWKVSVRPHRGITNFDMATTRGLR